MYFISFLNPIPLCLNWLDKDQLTLSGLGIDWWKRYRELLWVCFYKYLRTRSLVMGRNRNIGYTLLHGPAVPILKPLTVPSSEFCQQGNCRQLAETPWTPLWAEPRRWYVDYENLFYPSHAHPSRGRTSIVATIFTCCGIICNRFNWDVEHHPGTRAEAA